MVDFWSTASLSKWRYSSVIGSRLCSLLTAASSGSHVAAASRVGHRGGLACRGSSLPLLQLRDLPELTTADHDRRRELHLRLVHPTPKRHVGYVAVAPPHSN